MGNGEGGGMVRERRGERVWLVTSGVERYDVGSSAPFVLWPQVLRSRTGPHGHNCMECPSCLRRQRRHGCIVLTSMSQTSRGTLWASCTDPHDSVVLESTCCGIDACVRSHVRCLQVIQGVHDELTPVLTPVCKQWLKRSAAAATFHRTLAPLVNVNVNNNWCTTGSMTLLPAVRSTWWWISTYGGFTVVDASVQPEMPLFAATVVTIYMISELASHYHRSAPVHNTFSAVLLDVHGSDMTRCPRFHSCAGTVTVRTSRIRTRLCLLLRCPSALLWFPVCPQTCSNR